MYEPRRIPPSRRNKKQVIAHLAPVLVDAVHLKREMESVTIQEILAEAVNTAFHEFGRAGEILSVRRDRIVKRKKGLAQIQSSENTPPCRTGKRRLAAWFDTKEVEALAAFCAEVGTRIETLVEMGLRKTLSSST
jgi:phenylpyruvate tautomerase PptA (4-oxalocrotonate tautomerase family)